MCAFTKIFGLCSFCIAIATSLVAAENQASFDGASRSYVSQPMPDAPKAQMPLRENFIFSKQAGIDPIITGPNHY